MHFLYTQSDTAVIWCIKKSHYNFMNVADLNEKCDLLRDKAIALFLINNKQKTKNLE